MLPHRPRRLHRLPQRLDYTLIPAPLDLSLTTMTEKSPLPAIIVTPSSPSCDKDFSIAFLVPPPKPSLTERIKTTISSPIKTRSASRLPSNPFKMTASLMLILAIMMFVMAAHVITHRLATQRPHLEFRVMSEGEDSPMSWWFGFRELWANGVHVSNPAAPPGSDKGATELGSFEDSAWINSHLISTPNDNKQAGPGTQERDIKFVVIEDIPPQAAPAN